MAEITTGRETHPRLSADGTWWWTGQAWVRAKSDDGLWRWTGSSWVPATAFGMSGRAPAELSLALQQVAEGRFAQAGAVLATRAFEWRPSGDLSELVQRLQEARRRLIEIDEQLGSGDTQDLATALSQLVLDEGRRGRLRDEREALMTEVREFAARLGRRARTPTVKEADDLLRVARELDDRSRRLRAVASQLEEVERTHADTIAAARRELEAAEQGRQAALAEAAEGIRAAEAEHQRAVEEAQLRLQRVRTPGPGALQAQFGPVRLHSNVIEMPVGRAPTAGAYAVAATAVALWRDHRPVISDLTVLGAAGTEEFHQALARQSDALFLLAVGRTAAAILPCPRGQEPSARNFVTSVLETARRAEADRHERDVRVRLAERELEEVAADRGRVIEAEDAVGRVERDLGLIGPIEDARQRLASAGEDTPDLARARERLEALTRALTAPPEPLRSAERDL
jgi:hypothetical protein